MTISNDFQIAKLVSEEDFNMLMYWLKHGSRVKSLKILKCMHFESSWDSKYAHGFVIKIKAKKINDWNCFKCMLAAETYENWVLNFVRIIENRYWSDSLQWIVNISSQSDSSGSLRKDVCK